MHPLIAPANRKIICVAVSTHVHRCRGAAEKLIEYMRTE